MFSFLLYRLPFVHFFKERVGSAGKQAMSSKPTRPHTCSLIVRTLAAKQDRVIYINTCQSVYPSCIVSPLDHFYKTVADVGNINSMLVTIIA